MMARGQWHPLLLTSLLALLSHLSSATATSPGQAETAAEKQALLLLSEAELEKRFGRPVQPTHTSTYWDKIQHLVVLFLENRPHSHSP